MAKTYIDTVKYVVQADVKVDGMVEKPDIVGAVFGQTEGLLGDELDLRELQKNGRIGRIDVELDIRGGKAFGKLILPSSLDMVETSILAASLETVNRVGPCEAKISVVKIEDTRNAKRQQVVERAKLLLRSMMTEQIPESKEIAEQVRDEVKVSEVVSYGMDKLPAGPGIDMSDAVILVEGRADVINMLKADFKNVIGIGGASVPKSVIEICKRKEVTAFLDGDRGGDIILRELINACELDFVARAPIGREVEEITRKEIIQSLRRKLPIEQVMALMGESKERIEQYQYSRPRYEKRSYEKPVSPGEIASQLKAEVTPAQQIEQPQIPQQEVKIENAPVDFDPGIKATLDASLSEIEGTLKARMYNESLSMENEVPVRDLLRTLGDMQKVHALVLDGIITQRLVDLAEEKNVKFMVGIRQGKVYRKPANMAISVLRGGG